MRRAIAALAGCALALAAAGCGGSAGKAGSAPTGAGGETGGETASTGTHTSRLKVNTRPRYGTPPPSAPVQSGTAQIAYREITIQPDTVKVKVGTTVRWTNYDPIEHNVTSESGPQRIASGNFGEGASFAVKLTTPGTIHYRCTIHPTTMNGTIEVVR